MSAKTHFKQLVDSDWLGQWDLGEKEFVLVIASVERFEPEQKRKKRDPKSGKMKDEACKRLDIGFRNARKHWLAGPVSQVTIKSLYGPYIEDWIGKSIALYVDPTVRMGGETTGGIRVRPTIPRKGPSTDMPEAPVDEEKRAQIERAREQAEAEVALTREPGEEG